MNTPEAVSGAAAAPDTNLATSSTSAPTPSQPSSIAPEHPAPKPGDGSGPKYQVNIEGTLYPWDTDTITVPQIRTLGELPNEPVQIIDTETNDARTLGESEIVTLKPGMGFAKKVKFQRG